MQMAFILCFCTMCQIISQTRAEEENNESRTSEDNFALRLVTSQTNFEGPAKKSKPDKASGNSRSEEDSFNLRFTSIEKSPMIKEEDKEYEAEKKLGDMADLFGTNQHHSYPEFYKDLGRRFVLQYPYKEVSYSVDENLGDSHLIAVKAPPELVLAVAAKAALLDAAIPHHLLKEKLIDKEILRSGNYWNDVWREDVDPALLRTKEDKVFQSVKVKVLPESKLSRLVSELKKFSPRLIYVINNE